MSTVLNDAVEWLAGVFPYLLGAVGLVVLLAVADGGRRRRDAHARRDRDPEEGG